MVDLKQILEDNPDTTPVIYSSTYGSYLGLRTVDPKFGSIIRMVQLLIGDEHDQLVKEGVEVWA